MNNKYPEELKNLPIFEHLDTICENLRNSTSHFIVLTANTGAGKSTAIPFALMNHFSGKILMLEPRRLAVLNVAARVSDLLHEEMGQTCGYSIHLENKVSEKTRFICLTEAILTRKIQNDPSLVGISVIVIDEFHERSVHSDFALALLKEIMEIRDDLYVVVMSATINTNKVSKYLTDCPVYSVPGKLYPVQIEYRKNESVEQAVLNTLKTGVLGTVLVFLPGLREILNIQSELKTRTDVEIEILHSSVPMDVQKKVLLPAKESRVVLSSSIAETSVTVSDVSVVIDSGFARVTEFNQNIGMERLVTKRISSFSADQRTGRAGRTQSGKCIRLWSENEKLEQSQTPEILRTDLASLVLDCAEWGAIDYKSLNWLDDPSNGGWNAAIDLLTLLGCLKNSKITEIGKSCLALGIHPRLGCVALSGIPFEKIELSTGLAVEYLQTGQPLLRNRDLYVENLKKRVQIARKSFNLSTNFTQLPLEFSTGYALLCGFPDRIAVQQGINSNKYKFPSGRFASIFENIQPYPKYIVAPNVSAGSVEGTVHSFVPLEDSFAEKFMQDRAEVEVDVEFDGDNKIKKTEKLVYGKIVLKEKKLPVLDEDFVKAICTQVKKNGLNFLPMSDTTKKFLLRVQFYVDNMGADSIVELKNKFCELQENIGDWLPPFVPNGKKISAESVYQALYYYLDGDTVNKSVPTELMLANGKKRKIVYENQSGEIIPVLEIIIQHLFGCFETPCVLGKPVLLKLLSPARRPLQITRDLENFWTNTWPEICSEMKGRYPKHNWDYRTIVEES